MPINTNKIGVITGDIVGSSKLNIEERKLAIETIRKTVENQSLVDDIKVEFFRGDGFQFIVNQPKYTAKVAVILRTKLRTKGWDARLSIGIGTVEYLDSKSIGLSYGEAFLYSGKGLDNIGERRLVLGMKDCKLNKELSQIIESIDEILEEIDYNQSSIVLNKLFDCQKDKQIKEENCQILLNKLKDFEKLLNIPF